MIRIAGRIIVAIALVHIVFGLWMGFAAWKGIVQDGFFNAVGQHSYRQLIFWFTVFAIPLITFGRLMVWMDWKGIPVPRFVGWHLLVLAGVGVFLMPVSGFWLITVPAVLLLLESRRKPSGFPK